MPLLPVDYARHPEERPQADFDSLVYTLLCKGFEANERWPGVHVLNEVDVDVDAWATVWEYRLWPCHPYRRQSGVRQERRWQAGDR